MAGDINSSDGSQDQEVPPAQEVITTETQEAIAAETRKLIIPETPMRNVRIIKDKILKIKGYLSPGLPPNKNWFCKCTVYRVTDSYIAPTKEVTATAQIRNRVVPGPTPVQLEVSPFFGRGWYSISVEILEFRLRADEDTTNESGGVWRLRPFRIR